jgi:hypothetical protein
MQRLGKHISVAANQHETVEQAVFSTCPATGVGEGALTSRSNSKKESCDMCLLLVDVCPSANNWDGSRRLHSSRQLVKWSESGSEVKWSGWLVSDSFEFLAEDSHGKFVVEEEE